MTRRSYLNKRKHYKKTPRSIKAELWSILYRLIFFLLLFIGFKLFGMDIFDSFIIAILGVVAYMIVGVIMKKVKYSRK